MKAVSLLESRELLKIRMEHGSLIRLYKWTPREMAKLEEIRAMKEKFRH